MFRLCLDQTMVCERIVFATCDDDMIQQTHFQQHHRLPDSIRESLVGRAWRRDSRRMVVGHDDRGSIQQQRAASDATDIDRSTVQTTLKHFLNGNNTVTSVEEHHHKSLCIAICQLQAQQILYIVRASDVSLGLTHARLQNRQCGIDGPVFFLLADVAHGLGSVAVEHGRIISPNKVIGKCSCAVCSGFVHLAVRSPIAPDRQPILLYYVLLVNKFFVAENAAGWYIDIPRSVIFLLVFSIFYVMNPLGRVSCFHYHSLVSFYYGPFDFIRF
jgi:hypothetical protein